MHDFNDQLNNEDIDWFKPFFKIVSGTDEYTKTKISEDYSGVDAYANGVSFQCKIRHKFYDYDLCIELAHKDIQTGEWWKGWIHNEPTSQKTLYGWKACYRGKDNICLIMNSADLHSAYFANKAGWDKRIKKNRYPSKDARGRRWWTYCTYVPVNELRNIIEIGHYSKPVR